MAEPVLFELEGWPGGFNRSVDETALLEEELLEAVNVVIDERGDVSSRPGYEDSTKVGSTPDQLASMDSWWPNTTSSEVLVGMSPDSTAVHVIRSQTYPFAVDRVTVGAAVGDYAAPTKGYFLTDFVSLNSDDLYIVCRRGTQSVYRLNWVDDATAPTVTLRSPATMEMLEPLSPREGGTLTISATGGTFDVGSIGDTVAVAFDVTSAALQTALRGLESMSSTLTVTGDGPHLIQLSSVDPTIVTDGSSLTGGAGTAVYVKTSTTQEPDDQFPLAYHAITKHSRVWVANVKVGSDDYPSRVFYSDVLKPEKWYSLQYFDFNPHDGQEITALEAYGEAILVFKNHNISILTGKTEESYAITILDEAIGTTSPKTVAVLGSSMMFLDRDHGVWSFDGAGFVNASEQIRDYLLDGINYEYAFTASAFLRRGVYYLSVPWGASKTPNRTFVYDVQGDLWYEWDYGMNEAAALEGDFYAAVDGLDGFARIFYGTDDDGTDIDAYMVTGWLAPGGDGSQHRIRRLDASFADEGTAQAVKITAYSDYSATLFKTETVVPDGTALFQRIGGFGNERWKQIKLKIQNVTGSAFRVNRLSFRLTVARRGRGVDSPNG